MYHHFMEWNLTSEKNNQKYEPNLLRVRTKVVLVFYKIEGLARTQVKRKIDHVFAFDLYQLAVTMFFDVAHREIAQVTLRRFQSACDE